MSEWHIIPSNPRYELTREGLIRWVDSQDPVIPYVGRASVEETPHLRVRLRDEKFYPIAHSVADLIAEVFPDYEKPVVVFKVEQPLKPRTITPERERKKKSGGAYSKGEDRDKEWRIIPGFSNYEITADGVLWSLQRQKKIVVSYQKNGAKSYHIYADSGRKTTRNLQSLVDLAFPEFAKPKPVKEPKVRKRPAYRKPEDWHDIPGFDRYQISSDGGLRYKANKQILHNVEDGKIKLVKAFSVQELLELTFGEKEAA